jgi:hypothetical protein
MYICSKCQEEKPSSEFHKCKRNRHGVQYCCKLCQSIYKKSDKGKEIDKKYSKSDRGRETKKKYRECSENIIRRREYFKMYSKKENFKATQKRYRRTDKGKKTQERYETKNPNVKIARILRSRLRDALRGNFKSGSAVGDLGCSIDFLKEYLADKFQEGMSWDNYGEWHIDHKLPLSSFNLANREELLKAVHYTNLQPLWAIDNLKKSDRIL